MFFLFPRLRAAVFINLVGMRRALNSPLNGHLDLTPANLAALQRANYLFHSAHNWSLSKWFLIQWCSDWCSKFLGQERMSTKKCHKSQVRIFPLFDDSRAGFWSLGIWEVAMEDETQVPQVAWQNMFYVEYTVLAKLIDCEIFFSWSLLVSVL